MIRNYTEVMRFKFVKSYFWELNKAFDTMKQYSEGSTIPVAKQEAKW